MDTTQTATAALPPAIRGDSGSWHLALAGPYDEADIGLAYVIPCESLVTVAGRARPHAITCAKCAKLADELTAGLIELTPQGVPLLTRLGEELTLAEELITLRNQRLSLDYRIAAAKARYLDIRRNKDQGQLPI